MFENESAAGAVAMVRDGVDALLGLDASRLSQQQVLAVVRELERQKSRLAAVDHVLLAQVDERGMAGEYCLPSTAALVQQLLCVTASQASVRVAGARELTGRHDLTGTPLPPVLPAVAAALRAGSISATHAGVISGFMHDLPACVDREYGAALETCLVEHSAGLDPAQVARAAKKLLARLHADGDEPDDREQRRRRHVTVSKNPDGSSRLSGHLTPAATAVLEAIFDSLAAPVPSDEGQADDRTAGQRRHDALLDAGRRLLTSGSLPDCGGTPVTVTVTVNARDLHTATRGLDCHRADCGHSARGCHNGASIVGYGQTSHGELISIPELLTLAVEADIIPVVLKDAGGILAYGRTRRLASPAQRRALAARDRGCSFPSCTRPPSWCSAHHITAWIDDGETNLDNLTLLCGYLPHRLRPRWRGDPHYREFERRGWRCQMLDGLPHWTAPPWHDPAQTPRTNKANHVDITFDATAAGPTPVTT